MQRQSKKIIIIILILVIFTMNTLSFCVNEKQFFMEQKQLVSTTFIDISQSDWFYNSVKYVYENGIIDGRANSQFEPLGNLTIAEAISLASKLHNAFQTTKVQLTPSGSNWYDVFVNYALENNIIENGNFKTYEAYATRSQMAYIFSSLISQDITTLDLYYELPDVTYKTPYHASIMKLYNYGIISGKDRFGSFKPNELISRAEAVAILQKVMIYLTENQSYTYKEYYTKKTTHTAKLINNNSMTTFSSVKDLYGFYLSPSMNRYFQINENGLTEFYKENNTFKKGSSSSPELMKLLGNNRGILVWLDYFGPDHWLVFRKKVSGEMYVSVLWGEGGTFDLKKFATKSELDNYIKSNSTTAVKNTTLNSQLIFASSTDEYADIKKLWSRDKLYGAQSVQIELEVTKINGELVGILSSSNGNGSVSSTSVLGNIVSNSVESNKNRVTAEFKTGIVYGESYIYKVKKLIGASKIEVINDGYLTTDKTVLRLGDQAKIKITLIDSLYQNVFTGSKEYPISFMVYVND